MVKQKYRSLLFKFLIALVYQIKIKIVKNTWYQSTYIFQIKLTNV